MIDDPRDFVMFFDMPHAEFMDWLDSKTVRCGKAKSKDLWISWRRHQFLRGLDKTNKSSFYYALLSHGFIRNNGGTGLSWEGLSLKESVHD